jgi:hypothetical protein
VRTPVPASIASKVLVVVTPPGRAAETIPLQIDTTGAQWIGRGTPIDDPNAIVRITYASGEKPYWIDVPASAWNGAISSRPR